MANKTNLLFTVIFISLCTLAFAKGINYNYLADSSESVVDPMVFKNSVINTTDLSSVQAPLDGEVRAVTSSGLWYQYSQATKSWIHIQKISQGNFTGIQEAPIDGEIYGRKNSSWVTIQSSGTTGYIPGVLFTLDSSYDFTPKAEIDVFYDGAFAISKDGDLNPANNFTSSAQFTKDSKGDLIPIEVAYE